MVLPLAGNAATTATLNSLPPGLPGVPGVPGLPGQGFLAMQGLAGQGTVGNAAVASGAVAAPRGPVVPGAKGPTAAAPGPGAVKAKAPAAPAPEVEKQGRAEQPAEQQPEKTKGKGKAEAGGRRSPGADPKFQALKKDVAAKKRVVGTTHPPARTEAVAAQAAAVPPADDQEARGKAAHAEDMDAAQPKEFNKETFVAAVEKAIADRAPKNLDEADHFGDSGKAEEVKQEVQGKVGEGKQTSAQAIADTTAQVPQPAPDAKTVVAMAPDRPPGKPAGPNANQAVPDTLPASATDMSAGPDQVNQQMSQAKVTEQQLAKSNEPTFKAALADKKTMDKHSATAPRALRGAEAQELKSVKNNAAAIGPPAMTSMAGTRIAAGQQVTAGKTRAKGSDEEKRATVTALLQKVFDKTKADVEKILTDLDTTVDTDFTREEKLAREKFTREHTQGMEDYKDRRYSGVTGKARWVKDLFADLPEEANRIYERAKANYLTAMRQVITNIAGTVERELRRAKDRIATGRKELTAAVDKLPKDLQAIGQQAAGEFADRFDELRDTVNDKGTELVDTLATRYTDAVKEVDQEIAAEKEKNKGLVSKAKDAIAGAIQAIMELKDLLMGVLRKAVQAIGMILTDPIGFLGKLVTAVGGGLKLFMKNIGKHMQQGVLTWLLGTGSSAGVRIPAKFDIRGILLMIASLLGISWANIRSRLARKVPEQALTAAETAVPLVAAVKRQGVAGAWEDLKSRVGDLKKDLVDRLIKYLTPTIVIAGITWILSLLNPASAFIRACKMIIDIVRFIVTQARQIIDFVNAVLDAVIAIARGAAGVPAMVEQALARAIPVLIGALAAILGIGGIAGKVRQIFQQLARPVNRAIDWVIDKITGLVKKLWAKIKPKPKTKKKPGPKKPRKPLLARAKARLRGGDDSPVGQRKRLSSALAAGVAAVNRFRGRPVAGKILTPLLAVIRVRYGLDVLRPVAKGDHWTVYGRINPEGTRDSDARTEGDQSTGANPNFTADAKEFERKLAAKAATHRASNSALATMARKAKTYIQAKVGREWDRKAYILRAKVGKKTGTAPDPADAMLAEILTKIGQDDFKKSGYVGKKVTDVMAVFDKGTLTERFVHIVEFFTNILAKDLMDQDAEAEIEQYIVQSNLNMVFLEARRGEMRAQGLDPESDIPQRQVTRAIAPLPPGGAVEKHQDPARKKRPEGESRELGLTLEQTGFRFSARQVRMHKELAPEWDRSKPLRWVAGAKTWMIVEHNEWVREQLQSGLPLGAGPSGTTNTMMSAAEALGAETYSTRLACIAFLVGAQHHTLIEVMVAAEPFGCDFTRGQKIYRNVKPLNEATLRACGKNGRFPDEPTPGTTAAKP
ncbi:HPC2 multi-domain protein [Streptomyces sp. NPDC052236]|uniref:HPC2 multi-domain protein n=1 Tax=Streptomyces sp. NPDC052236 TaxID=3365686 RepID=UPI0037D61F1F